MTDELIKEWKAKIKILYSDTKIYMETIDDIIKSDITLFRDITDLIKIIDKTNSVSPTFSTSKDLFVSIGIIDNIVSSINKLIDIVTNPEHLQGVKNEMSDTYYKTINARRNKLVKSSELLYNFIDKITETLLNNVDQEIIKNTPIAEFERLYLTHPSSTSSRIFKYYLDMYDKNNINTRPLLEKMYDYILGYNGESLNDKPYSTHPLLLMGLSFNLMPQNEIIKEDIIPNTTTGGIITINNKINPAMSYTIYNIHALLNGKYTTVNRKESINSDTIIYSKTIQSIPLPKSINTNAIKNINTDNASLITVYESLDNGLHFRKMSEPISSDSVKYLHMGPKPRVYLYNSNCIDVITSKKNIKLATPLVKSKVEYVDATNLLKNRSLDSMYKEIAYSSNDKNKERRLYNIMKANTYLKEIKKVYTKSKSIIQIPFESPLVLNLFY